MKSHSLFTFISVTTLSLFLCQSVTFGQSISYDRNYLAQHSRFLGDGIRPGIDETVFEDEVREVFRIMMETRAAGLESEPSLAASGDIARGDGVSEHDQIWAALEPHLGALSSESDDPEKLSALEAIEEIMMDIHQHEALALDVDGVIITLGGYETLITNFAWQALSLRLEDAEVAELRDSIFKGDPKPGQNYPALKEGRARMNEFRAYAIEQFNRVLGPHFGREITEAEFGGRFVQFYYDHYEPFEDSLETLRILMQRGIRPILVSNNFEEKFGFLSRKFGILRELDAILSDDVGEAKPKGGMFSELIRRIAGKRGPAAVRTSRIMFLDDKEKNLVAARGLGINASLHQSVKEQKLSEHPFIHELLSKERLVEVLDRLRVLARLPGLSPTVRSVVAEVLSRLERMSPSAIEREYGIDLLDSTPAPFLRPFYEAPLGEVIAVDSRHRRVEVLLDGNTDHVEAAFGAAHRPGDRYFLLLEDDNVAAVSRENETEGTFQVVPSFAAGAAFSSETTYDPFDRYYMRVLNYLEAYQASPGIPQKLSLIGVEPPFPDAHRKAHEMSRDVLENARDLEEIILRPDGRQLDSQAVFRLRYLVLKASLPHWVRVFGEHLAGVMLPEHGIGVPEEAPICFCMDQPIDESEEASWSSIFNHHLSSAYYRSIFLSSESSKPDWSGYLRSMAEDPGLFRTEVFLADDMHSLYGEFLPKHYMSVLSRKERASFAAVYAQTDEVAFDAFYRLKSGVDFLDRKKGVYTENQPFDPEVTERRTVPVISLSRTLSRRMLTEDLEFIRAFTEDPWPRYRAIRPWAAYILGHYNLRWDRIERGVGILDRFYQALERGDDDPQVIFEIAQALDRHDIEVNSDTLARLIGAEAAQVVESHIRPNDLTFQEVVGSDLYSSRRDLDAHARVLKDFLDRSRQGHDDGEPLELLGQHGFTGARARLLEHVRSLEVFAEPEEAKYLERFFGYGAVRMAQRAHRELDALYEAQEELRRIEYEMVHHRAQMGLPARHPGETEGEFLDRFERERALAIDRITNDESAIVQYDEARREVANLIDRGDDFRMDGSGLRDIHNAVERLGLDYSFVRRYHLALKRWKAARSLVKEKLRNDDVTLGAFRADEQVNEDVLVSVMEKVSQVVENRRQLKDFRLPLVVFVTGSNGTGKSTISERIGRLIGAAPTAIDAIRQILRGEIQKEEFPVLHSSSFNLPPGERFFDYLFEQTELIFTGSNGRGGVMGAVSRRIEEGKSSLFEGYQAVPGALPLELYGKANVIHVVLDVPGETEEDRIEAQLLRFTHGRSTESKDLSRAASRYTARIPQIRAIQSTYRRLAERVGVPVVVEDTLEKVVMAVADQLIGPYSDARPFAASDEARRSRDRIDVRRRILRHHKVGRAVRFGITDEREPVAFVSSAVFAEEPGLETAFSAEVEPLIGQLGERVVLENAQTGDGLRMSSGRVLTALHDEMTVAGIRGESAAVLTSRPLVFASALSGYVPVNSIHVHLSDETGTLARYIQKEGRVVVPQDLWFVKGKVDLAAVNQAVNQATSGALSLALFLPSSKVPRALVPVPGIVIQQSFGGLIEELVEDLAAQMRLHERDHEVLGRVLKTFSSQA